MIVVVAVDFTNQFYIVRVTCSTLQCMFLGRCHIGFENIGVPSRVVSAISDWKALEAMFGDGNHQEKALEPGASCFICGALSFLQFRQLLATIRF